MNNQTYLNRGNEDYINYLYDKYREDESSVEAGWQSFFQGFDLGISLEPHREDLPATGQDISSALAKEMKVLNLIDAYRRRGHLFADTNPVRRRRQHFPGLALEAFGLGQEDLDTAFAAGGEIGLQGRSLKAIIEALEQTYCRSIGVEYKYIREPEKLNWLQQKMEATRNTPSFNTDEKKGILNKLNHAVTFENFLHTKFVGQKRFSLEGAEALIPALDLMIQKDSGLGAEEFIIGMGHRGRLNVLANVARKGYGEIFAEFLGKSHDPGGRFAGDVKYHLGYTSDIEVNGKTVRVNISPNPSHLEAVDAVIQGQARAKTDDAYQGNTDKVVPVTIHGDAALAGQGVVYELLQMSKLEGYQTGGTIHLVINNQVGFTTDYKDARSSTYCTDLAKVVLAPVFHVNGDDAEAVSHVLKMAMEYRHAFHEDIFIDILSYRKYGHNEGDEPKFTQPVLYKAIESHPNPKDLYALKLLSEKGIPETYPAEIEDKFKDELQTLLEQSKAQEGISAQKPVFTDNWEGMEFADSDTINAIAPTAIAEAELLDIAEKITRLPQNGKFLKKIERLFESRHKTLESKTFDWAMGELLAYGSLLKEGSRVRISGEDVERGTFSHRHAVLSMEDTGEEYVPLNALGTTAPFEIYNSLLSEYAVLGFEYGYAMANPQALVVWEAQFGDFANTAQVIIDQYISSAETKWKVPNGLVLLLPHGHEGQGPEHTSARIERFLELCAGDNIQVVNCSTPANFFHVLRRQQHRNFRKPLVVFTPKSLLRHPKCVSVIEDFTKGHFMELIDDVSVVAGEVKKVLLCSGKIYYDLLEKQQADARNDVAIVRLEQLYPTPLPQMEALVSRYGNSREFTWVQEEPENMGAWPYLYRKLRKSSLKLEVISRPESSSTATGYAKVHERQQAAIVEAAFSMEEKVAG